MTMTAIALVVVNFLWATIFGVLILVNRAREQADESNVAAVLSLSFLANMIFSFSVLVQA